MDGYSQYISPLAKFALPTLGGRQSLVPDPNTFPDAQGTAGDPDSSFLGKLAESSLGGLGYVGKVLNKTFGGRAIRGVLGGHYDELASILPLSDTLGITNENREVQGTDINNNLGLTDPNDDSFYKHALGFATETLLDPATYLSFGAKTAAGLLKKSSDLAPTLAGGIRAGDRSLIGLGLPFSKPSLNVGTGELAAKIAESNAPSYLGRQVEKVTGGYVNPYTFGAKVLEPVGRIGRTLFDGDVQGAVTKTGQALATNEYTPALKYGLEGSPLNATVGSVDNIVGGRIGADQAYTDYISKLLPIVDGKQAQANDVLRGLRYQAEGYAPQASAALSAAGLSPAEIAAATGHTDEFANLVRTSAANKREFGIDAPELQDDFSKYFPRESNPVGRQANESATDYFRRRSQEQLSGKDDSQLARESILKNIPGGTNAVNDLFANPGLRAMTPLARESEVGRALNGGNYLAPDSPLREQAADLSKRIAGASDDYLGDTKFFNDDLTQQGLKSLKAEARTKASAHTIYQALDPKYKAVAPVAEFEKAGRSYTTVPELLRKGGLTLKHDTEPGKLVSEFLAAEKLGINTSNPKNLDALKNLAIPQDVADDILKIGKAWQSPKELAPVIAAWDWATNLFKTSVTTLFPAFHTRNGVSALFNMWRDDALSLPAMKDGVSLLRGGTVASKIPGLDNLSDAEKAQQLVKEMVANKVAFVKESRTAGDLAARAGPGDIFSTEFPKVGGSVRPLAQDAKEFASGLIPQKGSVGESLNPLNIQGVNRDTDKFIPVAAGRKIGSAVEDFARSSHYISLRSQGVSAAEAAERVKKYHIDYGDFTQFEQQVGKRLFPWYSFSRKTLPPLLEDLATKPAKVAAGVRLTTGVREPGSFVPDYIGEGAAIPLPGAPEGQQRYISSFGLPFEDESIKTLGSLAQGDLQRAGQQVFGMAQPWLKVPAEIASGKQFYSGRKLEDLKPYESINSLGLLPEDRARQLTQIIANTPASRAFSTVDKLLDSRKGLLPTATNLLTGGRITDIDVAKQQDIATRELLKKLLVGQSGVKTREDVYVPQDKIGQLDPYDLQLYSNLKDVEKRVNERNKAR